MKLFNSAGQNVQHYLYVADGTITTGGTAQLLLGRSIARSSLLIQNTSAGPLYIEMGSGRATATLTGGVVTSIAVTNAGMGFTRTPLIQLQGGGGNDGPNANSSYVGLGQPNAASPHNFATAHCVMTGSAPNQTISSIVVDNGGSKYLAAPMVFLRNDLLDPNGCAAPSATSGILLSSGAAPLFWNGTTCPTDSIAIFGATTGQSFVCRWTD